MSPRSSRWVPCFMLLEKWGGKFQRRNLPRNRDGALVQTWWWYISTPGGILLVRMSSQTGDTRKKRPTHQVNRQALAFVSPYSFLVVGGGFRGCGEEDGRVEACVLGALACDAPICVRLGSFAHGASCLSLPCMCAISAGGNKEKTAKPKRQQAGTTGKPSFARQEAYTCCCECCVDTVTTRPYNRRLLVREWMRTPSKKKLQPCLTR